MCRACSGFTQAQLRQVFTIDSFVFLILFFCFYMILLVLSSLLHVFPIAAGLGNVLGFEVVGSWNGEIEILAHIE